MGNIVKECIFESFDDFMKSISYGGDLYGIFCSDFIFRGESSDKFKLIPSALRDCNRDKVMKLGHCHGFDKNRARITAEYVILRQFYYTCDSGNLYVPSCRLRKYPIDDISIFLNRDIWLSEDLYEIAGLAQHYGLPTRLLDWSQDMYISLYFACIGAMNSIKNNGLMDDDYIVLWALNAKKIEVDKSINKVIPMVFVRPPYYGNPNLGAQKGLFTLWEFVTFEHRNNDFVATPLDVFLQNHAKDDSAILLYKLKLSSKWALNLYCMLSKMGYNASHVFPGYHGVSQKISEDMMYNQIVQNLKTKAGRFN